MQKSTTGALERISFENEQHLIVIESSDQVYHIPLNKKGTQTTPTTIKRGYQIYQMQILPRLSSLRFIWGVIEARCSQRNRDGIKQANCTLITAISHRQTFPELEKQTPDTQITRISILNAPHLWRFQQKKMHFKMHYSCGFLSDKCSPDMLGNSQTMRTCSESLGELSHYSPCEASWIP